MPKVSNVSRTSTNGQDVNKKTRRTRVSQSDVPQVSLSEAVRVAAALRDEFGGKAAAPFQVAMALDMSPSSSKFRAICGAAIAYGLTAGGNNAKQISLQELGKKVVAPTSEGEDDAARVEAALRPRVLREFFQRYDGAKFPQDKIAENVLLEMGVQQNRIDGVLNLIKENGEFSGIIHETKTGPFVALNSPVGANESGKAKETEVSVAPDLDAAESDSPQDSPDEIGTGPETSQVFISHGKNKQVVTQIKEILTFGKFSPVIAEEHETTSRPVPDKVLDEMRSCFAGIIHVEVEGELLDGSGNKHRKINENVLIEIGASMALYGRNIVLLVQRGTQLPSNLQGLYICEYEGDRLDYEATMKLLKSFNEFRPLSEQSSS